MSAAYPANRTAYRDVDVQATAVLPLNHGGAPVGMMAFHWRDRQAFTEAERDLARAFTDTTAQALERARLYAEVRGTAEALQRSLLPAFLPTFPEFEIAVRYRPASETLAIGGDWYDVVEAHHGQVGIAVGDVGGKGVEAAAVMGRLRTAMRAYAIEHAAPSDVLRHLVAYHAVTRPDVFATVLYAALDRRHRRLRIASLGHPLPLLIRDGRLEPLTAPADAPLGADAERAFGELAVPVQAGDLLLFVTDGVFERPGISWDESLRQLGSAAAASSVSSVERIADDVIDSINDDASARDDRALVVVKVPERIGGSPSGGGEAERMAVTGGGADAPMAPGDPLPADAQSSVSSESPISHSIGGHRPTNRARRSALPRSS
jgi:serine phosphatase RsbU (regulator of sigma subunit)